jgi:hypothetical protein
MKRYAAGFVLLMTYLVVMLHNALPHHHHTDLDEANDHHHAEQSEHHHSHSHDHSHNHSHDHEPSSVPHSDHLVHSPDFGSEYLNSTFDMKWKYFSMFICTFHFELTSSPEIILSNEFTSGSPPLKGRTISAHALRGPPLS